VVQAFGADHKSTKNFMKKIKLEKKSLLKCKKCNQLYCKYITEKIPAPRTIRDFDGLLWQLSIAGKLL